MATKRTLLGNARPIGPNPYQAECIPDPWLVQFELDPPGHIRAVRGNLSTCYVKERVEVPLHRRDMQADGTCVLVRTGTRTAYVWTLLSEE